MLAILEDSLDLTQLLSDLGDALPERYRLDRQIGQGGMATVFVAEDTRYGRKVAIKVLHPDLTSSVAADRFEREIQVLGRLNHPHILPVLDSGGSKGLFYYVMPFVEGESLRDRLHREGQLPIDDAIAITCEVADALGHAHTHGIIHRDIKPENVLIHGGHAVVTDFGIARLAQDAAATTKLTKAGISVGTAEYMSPQQAAGEPLDTRSDIYSLGCMMYELLTGDPPFMGANPRTIMARHTLEDPQSIRVVRPAVPLSVEEAVLQALEKSPDDRHQSMEAFSRALLGQSGTASTWRASQTIAMRTLETPSFDGQWRRGWRLAAMIAAAGLAAALVWLIIQRAN